MLSLHRFWTWNVIHKMEEDETPLCLHKITGTLDKVILPENVYSSLDQIEETLTGEVTTHRVNGIIVQPRAFGRIIVSLGHLGQQTNHFALD